MTSKATGRKLPITPGWWTNGSLKVCIQENDPRLTNGMLPEGNWRQIPPAHIQIVEMEHRIVQLEGVLIELKKHARLSSFFIRMIDEALTPQPDPREDERWDGGYSPGQPDKPKETPNGDVR